VSTTRQGHLVERAVERMAELGTIPATGSANAVPPGRSTYTPSSTNPGVPIAETVNTPGELQDVGASAPITVTMDMLRAAGLAVAEAQRSRLSEEWRVTAGQLLRTMRAARIPNEGADAPSPNLLLITSSAPKEGKSFSALNLAGSLALGGQSEVLLIDLDSKPRGLTTMLGLAERSGLFDLVADPALQSEELILSTAIRGFNFLPIGRAAPNGPGSVERTISRSVVTMIEKLARRNARRLVILDSAPCLATSDASTLAPVMSQIAVVVEAERTQRHNVEAVLELLRPCPNITLILNKIRPFSTSAYHDYHYHRA
jgi:protein-tyrosine kinase